MRMLLLQELLTPDSPATFEWFDKLSGKFFIRLGIDLISVLLLIRLIYYRIYRKADLFLTFFIFNLIIFLITFLLNKVQMSIGAAFGLFAVFSMLRYRTEDISAKDMTYLFVVIAMGLISAIVKGSWDELGLINGLILLCVQLLEGNWLIRREWVKTIQYDKIELILPSRRADLIADLEARTGLTIHRIEIRGIDFLKDTARIAIYFHQNDTQTHVKTHTDPPLVSKMAATE
jgi:hypothetical protein